MPLPTTATGPTNVYFVEDDTAATANTLATPALTAGGSGAQISPEFTAPSAAAALTIAHLLASVLQRPVRLINKYSPASGTPPWTLVQGAAANVALTSVPSGVGF